MRWSKVVQPKLQCMHGRTKSDGYRADRINWKKIGKVRERLSIPVIANGEIWH